MRLGEAGAAPVGVRSSKPGRSAAIWQRQEGGLLIALVFVLVTVLAVLPLGQLVATAVAPRGSLDLSEFGTLAGDEVWRATRNTIVVGLGSAALALAVGLLVALLLAVSDMPGKLALAFMFVLSLMIAPQVVALAFKTLAGPASPLLKSAGLAPAPGTPNPMLGPWGIVLVMGLHHAPLAAVILAPGLAAIPRALIESAAVDGARPLQIVRRILLPLLRPYLLGAGLLAVVAGFGNFGIPTLLGQPVGFLTLPTLVYQKIASFGPAVLTQAAVLSLWIAALSGTGVLAASIALPAAAARLDAEVAMVPFWRLGRWRWPVATMAWMFIGVSVILPLVSLVATALVPAYGVRLTIETFTLGRFYEVLVRQDLTLRAFRNSLLLAGAAAVLLAMLATLCAYVLERRLYRLKVAILAVAEMPYAVPGLVLSVGCILLLVKPVPLIGVSLYATPWIILFAYLARFFAIALKPTTAAMATLALDQEEAAAVFGASFRQRLRYIVMPHLAAPAVAGGLLVFLLAFNELTVSALLWTAGTETLGVALLNLEDAGLGAEAAAVGVTATAIVAAVMLGLDRLSGRLPADVLAWRALARGGADAAR